MYITFKDFLNESKREIKPDFFSGTHYRLPELDELKDIDSYKLTSDEIVNGFYYNMVGKGMLDNKNKQQIITSIESLIELYPDNTEYKDALLIANNLTGRFVKV